MNSSSPLANLDAPGKWRAAFAPPTQWPGSCAGRFHTIEDHCPSKNHLLWQMPTPKLIIVDCSWWSTLSLYFKYRIQKLFAETWNQPTKTFKIVPPFTQHFATGLITNADLLHVQFLSDQSGSLAELPLILDVKFGVAGRKPQIPYILINLNENDQTCLVYLSVTRSTQIYIYRTRIHRLPIQWSQPG